jgi:drug/metabolite transporter (DMT)-like permease
LATSDALTKKALQVHGVYLVAWLRLLWALPLLFMTQLFVPLPRLDKEFYTTLLIAMPFELAAFILYMKALKISPMSLTLPFLALTPVFLIVVPSILLGERVTLSGAAGILLIAAGGYTLNIKDFRKGLLEPFAAVGRERGALYMMAVAVIYSFTATLCKKVIIHSAPVFAALAYYVLLFAMLIPIALKTDGQNIRRLRLDRGALRATIMPGLLDSVAIMTNMIALSMTKTAYMVSVKRLSLLIGVLYGYYFFREKGIRERLAGTVLMLAGFVVIVLYS